MSQHDHLERFAVRRAEAARILRRLADTMVSPLAAEQAPRIRALADRTESGKFSVVMLGAFSTGKTTLLDALLGQPLLPQGVHPCTAVLTEVRWGDSNEVVVHTTEGQRTVDLDAFRAWYHLEGGEVTNGAGDRFEHVEKATVSVQTPLLSQGVTLVDTPGLDDDPVRTARTLDALTHADAVIFVTAAPRCLGHLERSLLTEHVGPLGLENLFLAVTMVDLLEDLSDDPSAARAAVESRCRQVFSPYTQVDGKDRFDDRAFLLDGRGALQARWDAEQEQPRTPADAESAQASGILAFEASLTRFLGEERGHAHLGQVIATVDAVNRELERRRDAELATLDTTAAELRQRYETLGPELAALETTVDRVRAIADDFIDAQAARVDESMHRFLYETIDALPEAIDDADPGLFASVRLLTESGREDVAKRLSSSLEFWLRERQDEWRTRIEASLIEGMDDLATALGPEAARFDTLQTEVEGRFHGATLPPVDKQTDAPEPDTVERWVSVALGALLMSPGTAAAGWQEGMEAVVEGAAGRLAARMAIFILGALTGPVGWTGLLIYAASDALMLLRSGSRQVDQLKTHLVESARDALKLHEETTTQAMRQEVRGLLAPLRARVVETVRADVRSVANHLQSILEDRERTEDEREDLADSWQDALDPLADARQALGALQS